MKAKRIDNSSDHSVPELKSGQFYYDEQMQTYFVMTPNGMRGRLTSKEHVTIEKDGAITVEPKTRLLDDGTTVPAPGIEFLYDSENKGRTWRGDLTASEWIEWVEPKDDSDARP